MLCLKSYIFIIVHTIWSHSGIFELLEIKLHQQVPHLPRRWLFGGNRANGRTLYLLENSTGKFTYTYIKSKEEL